MAFRTGRAVIALALALGAITALSSACAAARNSADGITYYVSPSGHDAAVGTTPASAWRSLARASEQVLHPGDQILLAGRHRFTGELRIGRQDGGDAARPVVIGSYGAGRAVITSASSGIVVVNTGGVTIQDLIIRGRHAELPNTAGVELFSSLSGHRMLDHVVIKNVDASGFGAGISISATHDFAGFDHVWITESAVHGNLDAGLVTYGPAFDPAAPAYAHQNIHVSDVQAYGNLGDPKVHSHSTGSGIVLGGVRDATITGSSAHGNGGAGGSIREGPNGIWSYDSTHVLIAHDVSFGNWSATLPDGGGFGLDQNTFDSVMEYNLSFGNHGPGFLLYSGPRQTAQARNVVRFNISSGDCRAPGTSAGAITIGGQVRDAAIYQNTAVMRRSSSRQSAALKLVGTLAGIRVLNNIFVAARSGLAVRAKRADARSVALLAGNDYFAAAGPAAIQWGSTWYPSLRAWRSATGQERVHNRPAGLSADPRFAGRRAALPPGPDYGAAYRLLPGSPLVHAGLDLRRFFGIRPGTVTYSGRPVPVSTPNVGAQ